jgi:hypothetical protein
LRDAGVQGVPRSNSSCAVALYAAALLRADQRIRSVAVGPCTLVLTLTRDDGTRPGGRLIVQLPKAVRGFVAGFDAQEYPEVVRGALPDALATSGPGPAEPQRAGTPDVVRDGVLIMRTITIPDEEPEPIPSM